MLGLVTLTASNDPGARNAGPVNGSHHPARVCKSRRCIERRRSRQTAERRVSRIAARQPQSERVAARPRPRGDALLPDQSPRAMAAGRSRRNRILTLPVTRTRLLPRLSLKPDCLCPALTAGRSTTPSVRVAASAVSSVRADRSASAPYDWAELACPASFGAVDSHRLRESTQAIPHLQRVDRPSWLPAGPSMSSTMLRASTSRSTS